MSGLYWYLFTPLNAVVFNKHKKWMNFCTSGIERVNTQVSFCGKSNLWDNVYVIICGSGRVALRMCRAACVDNRLSHHTFSFMFIIQHGGCEMGAQIYCGEFHLRNSLVDLCLFNVSLYTLCHFQIYWSWLYNKLAWDDIV